MKKELVDKQRPILDMYQNLSQIKKRLEELGKHVKLEEVKLIPFDDLVKKPAQNMVSVGLGQENCFFFMNINPNRLQVFDIRMSNVIFLY